MRNKGTKLIEELFKEAKEEHVAEKENEYRKEIKVLLERKRQAESVVRNVENEILDLKARIAQELK